MFTPKTVYDWYQERDKWIKPLVFVGVLVVVAVAGVWFVLSRFSYRGPSVHSTSTDGLIEALEDEHESIIESAEKRSCEIDEELSVSFEDRLEIEKNLQKTEAARKSEHEKYNSVSDNYAIRVVEQLKSRREEHK